jgi:RNA polymerase sigma-70 factor (ECF subfamily)
VGGRAEHRLAEREFQAWPAVSDAVSVDDAFVGRGHRIRMPQAPPSVDARGPDTESRGWVAALSATGSTREQAVQRLHALLVRAARFEIARRRRAFGGGGSVGQLDDLAMQAADDALMAILDKLHTYRGDSRFTTWAYKFALLEAGVKMRRRAWQEREIPLEEEGWVKLADRRASPAGDIETGEVIAAVCDAIASTLTPHQRAVLIAITLNDVPIDVLAERLSTTRGALYKTLHDARRKLRTRLAEAGLAPDSGGAGGTT